MKKFWTLFSLFLLPLVFYIFLSQGIYKYANLPILTEKVNDISTLDSDSNATFEEHLTVVCFLGSNLDAARAAIFNVNQTIYKRYYQKPFFQAVAVLPTGSKEDFAKTISELGAYTDVKNWHFVFADESAINTFYASFETDYSINQNNYSEFAYIVDREMRLRGRKDDDDSADGILYGYDMRSVATLKDKMKDDIDIIYYQLKKSAEKQKRRKRDI